MNVNLSKRLLFWVGLPAFVLFAGVVGIATSRSYQRLVEQTERLASAQARFLATQLERRLASAAKIPEDLRLALETQAFTTPTALEQYLASVIQQSPEIYGSCLAFEPHTFALEQQYYAPYFYRKGEQATFVQLGNPEYNYFNWDWYKRPKLQNRSLWSEPYFDEGGGDTVMVTYSVPFYRPNRAFWGIATIDLSMSQLTAEVARLQVGNFGYTFLISKAGRFLAYPDPTKIMKASLQEANPELARQMLQNLEGFTRTAEPLNGRPAWVTYVPVQGGEFFFAIAFPEAEVLSQAVMLQWELIVLGFLGLVVLFFALWLVARSISRPITALAAAAQRVAAGDLEQEVRVEARTTEVQQLATAFRQMTKDLRMQMAELRYTVRVKERFEGELSAARSIQMSLVQKRFPAFPERPEVDLHAIIRPARAVGGDFYDFFFIEEDCLCLVAADVAGKGVPAALYMAVCKTLLRAKAALAATPAEMLERVNNELCAQSVDSGMFVSLVFCLLNVRTGEVQVCNAGHPAPLRLGTSGKVEPLASTPGVALGAWAGAHYKVTTHQLTPGDSLCFFTDGVTEALDTGDRFYGAERLRQVLGGFYAAPAEQVTRAVVQDVRAFSGQQEQADDITLLVVRWVGPAAALAASAA